MTEHETWTERRTLLAGDLSDREIRGLARSGELHRFRRGRYAVAETWAAADETEQHRIRALEMGHWLEGRAAISHESAAILHGMQRPNGPIPKVHATWSGSAGRSTTTNITPHRSVLADTDVMTIDGVLLTVPSRTVFDVARSTRRERAIAVADSALRLQLCTPTELASILTLKGRTPGAFRARQIIEFADARSESVGESICRLRMAQIGLPVPVLQSVVRGLSPAFDARVDFEIEEFRTVAEFDGLTKYGRLLKPGQTASDVVVAEKIREDRIRDTGRECVRVIWADFGDPDALLARFLAAFRRAGFPDWQPQGARFCLDRPGPRSSRPPQGSGRLVALPRYW